FYIDPKSPGIVRGGFYDDMGGIIVGERSMLIGIYAQEVCDMLNAQIKEKEK
ncbi:hypothetical protein LCGC14_2902150, partial [marine sediment metagenome]